MTAAISIRAFAAADQDVARRLILEGLGEHFGFIDERINTDLDDIALSYHSAHFLLACDGDAVIGTGALVRQADGSGRIVRMSCAAAYRRRGIGSAIVEQLIERARGLGCPLVVLQTNDDWDDANGFYRAIGFAETRREPEGIAYELRL